MFEHIAPEEAGVRSEGIVRFLDSMKEKHLHLHDMIILRRGRVIAEASFAPWSKDRLHMLFSLSKSFTSTAVGFAVQDGLLKVTDRLTSFFPELLPAPRCENMQKITIRHMLSINTGHAVEPVHRTDCWEAEFLRSYVEYEPGTHFLYNTFATYMLAAVVQKVTGKKMIEYLREKLFDPLGMSKDIWFEESPTGVATGGYGLNVRVEDIAKLGQFYLQNGKWEGKQLLNDEWIRDAQTPWSDNRGHGGEASDWGSGYGYQFWMCRPDKVFRGDGAFGQFCVIMPEQEMVIAINSGLSDMGAVLNAIWEQILPCVSDRLPAADGALEKRLSASATTTPAFWEEDGSCAQPPVPENNWLGSFRLQTHNQLGCDSLMLTEGALLFRSGEKVTEYPLCFAEWKHAEDGESAARAAKAEDKLLVHICRVLTPFEYLLKFSFTDHGIEIALRSNTGSRHKIIGYRI